MEYIKPPEFILTVPNKPEWSFGCVDEKLISSKDDPITLNLHSCDQGGYLFRGNNSAGTPAGTSSGATIPISGSVTPKLFGSNNFSSFMPREGVLVDVVVNINNEADNKYNQAEIKQKRGV